MDLRATVTIDEYIAKRDYILEASELTAYKIRYAVIYDWYYRRRRWVALQDIGRQGDLHAAPEIEISPEMRNEDNYSQVGPHPRTVKMMKGIRHLLRNNPGMTGKELSQALGRNQKQMITLMRTWMADELRKVEDRAPGKTGRMNNRVRYYLIDDNKMR